MTGIKLDIDLLGFEGRIKELSKTMPPDIILDLELVDSDKSIIFPYKDILWRVKHKDEYKLDISNLKPAMLIYGVSSISEYKLHDLIYTDERYVNEPCFADMDTELLTQLKIDLYTAIDDELDMGKKFNAPMLNSIKSAKDANDWIKYVDDVMTKIVIDIHLQKEKIKKAYETFYINTIIYRSYYESQFNEQYYRASTMDFYGTEATVVNSPLMTTFYIGDFDN